MTPREARAALWKSRKATTELTIRDVANEYGLDAATLFADRTRKGVAGEARREVMVRLYERGLSASEIGRLVGRDHTSVLGALKTALGDQYGGPGRGGVRVVTETHEEAAQ